MNKLNTKGIKSSIYYENPIHKQPIIKKLSLNTEKLANTEKISREIMSIPFYAFMKKVEKESVVKELKIYILIFMNFFNNSEKTSIKLIKISVALFCFS